jgi:hypothetical protein
MFGPPFSPSLARAVDQIAISTPGGHAAGEEWADAPGSAAGSAPAIIVTRFCPVDVRSDLRKSVAPSLTVQVGQVALTICIVRGWPP